MKGRKSLVKKRLIINFLVILFLITGNAARSKDLVRFRVFVSNNFRTSLHDTSGILSYGFELPSFQYRYNDKQINFNLVPGFYADYRLTKRMNIGVTFMPYLGFRTEEQFAYTTKETLPDSFVLKKVDYFINKLKTVSGNFQIGYTISKQYQIDVGLGLQQTLNGKGKALFTYFDSTGLNSLVISHIARYIPSNTAFNYVYPITGYLQVNVWRTLRTPAFLRRGMNDSPADCQLGISFHQNLKSWYEQSSKDYYFQINSRIGLSRYFKKRQ